MNRTLRLTLGLFLAAGVIAASQLSCVRSVQKPAGKPTFKLACSVYTSWNTYFSAGKTKMNGELLIEKEAGKMGLLEKKWGVDIEVLDQDYGTTIQNYASGQCDAVCITNMDALNPALGRKSVVIMPNSTSFGADALVVTPKVPDLDKLATMETRLLEASVSHYCFARGLELKGKNVKGYKIINMDPEAIAPAMQQGQAGFDAGMLWNPLLRATLNSRKDCKVLFDSTTIPGEIIDTVVMAQASLDKPGGKDAACCLIDIFYTYCKLAADQATYAEAMKGLG
jgi:ABC-type nitrate/sulfonate/bicarbonate transport system substrate-binding protein